MEIIIRGDKIEVTKAMKDYIKEKLKRLDKYLENSDAVRASVVVRVSSHRQTVEITIPLHNFIIRSEETQEDFYAAVDKAIENAQMEIPDAMLNTQVRQMLDDFSRRMQSQGLSMDQYFQFTGMTADKMMEDMKPQALKRIQTRLVLEKVAEVENIQPTEEEVNEEISKMAEAYKMEADKLKELLGERELEQMKKDMAVQKAVTVIADAAKEV